ncbi:MFS transporter [Paenibacillus dokdonensis]|uniref:MFS transporter n=1 Tax=Paenibacillus dokdonensis TaxID=2567944 RepID=UPI00319E7178
MSVTAANWVGTFAAMPVLATIFGAVVSGIIVDKFDFFPFFVFMGSFVIIMGIFTIFTLQDAPHLKAVRHEKGYFHQFASVFKLKTVMANQELFWVFVINAVYFIGFNVYFPYITIYFNNYLHMSYMTAGALHPEDQRGQFEGIKQVFGICIPMVVGPLISYYIIQYNGIRMEIDGVMGTVPSNMLFLFSALLTLFTFLPLLPANRLHRSRMHPVSIQPLHEEDLNL